MRDPQAAAERDFVSPATRMVVQLKQQIRSGGLALGSALPTERELADRFDVSRWTVRQALHALQREHLIVRQQGRGTFVASSLYAELPPSTRTGLLGVMVWDLEYGFSGLVQGACAAAARHGYAVTTGSIHGADEEARSMRAFLRNAVLGVIIAPRTEAGRRAYQELLADGVAVVLADTLIRDMHEDHVLINNARGTAISTQHLIDLGHRRLGYIGHSDTNDWPIRPERRRGFLETCREAGVELHDGAVIETTLDDHAQRLARLLSSPQRPTGIVAYNDAWAIRVIQVARELGLRVPRDLSVVGFDDSTLAPGYDVPLTTINPERHEMGVTAIELLVEKIERKTSRPRRSILIEPKLIERQSTRRL